MREVFVLIRLFAILISLTSFVYSGKPTRRIGELIVYKFKNLKTKNRGINLIREEDSMRRKGKGTNNETRRCIIGNLGRNNYTIEFSS